MIVRSCNLFCIAFSCDCSCLLGNIHAIFYHLSNCMLWHTCASTYYMYCHVMFNHMFYQRSKFSTRSETNPQEWKPIPCKMLMFNVCCFVMKKVIYNPNLGNKELKTWRCILNLSTQLQAPSDMTTTCEKRSEHCFSNSGTHDQCLHQLWWANQSSLPWHPVHDALVASHRRHDIFGMTIGKS